MPRKVDPEIQAAIDYLLPLAARLRMDRGPDDDDVFRMGKALAALTQPKHRAASKGRAVKAKTKNGQSITIAARLIEDAEG